MGKVWTGGGGVACGVGWGVGKVDWGEGVGWGCAVGLARRGEG